MPGGTLDQMMREQGVRVVSRSSATEERDWESAIGAAAAITTLMVEGRQACDQGRAGVVQEAVPQGEGRG